MEIIIIPSFKCNFNCSYCIQIPDKTNTKLMNLDRLKTELDKYIFDEITLLGGELSILPEDYLNKLLDLLETYNKPIYIFTNLYNIIPRFEQHKLFVSWDFELRMHVDRVLNNMFLLSDFSISTTVTKTLLRKDIKEVVQFYENFKNLRVVEFNAYHLNEKNHKEATSTEEYAGFLKAIKLAKPNFVVENFKRKKNNPFGDKLVLDPDFSQTSFTSSLEDRSIKEIKDCINCDVADYCSSKYSTAQDDYTKCLIREVFLM